MLDSSVIAKLIMREEGYEKAAEKIEEDGETLDLALIEVTNVILKYLKRGEITADEAKQRFKELLEVFDTLDIRSSRQFIDQAFEIAASSSITIYDSLYIAGGEILITADKKQAEAASKLRKLVLVI